MRVALLVRERKGKCFGCEPHKVQSGGLVFKYAGGMHISCSVEIFGAPILIP
jgi:hypothetical protein